MSDSGQAKADPAAAGGVFRAMPSAQAGLAESGSTRAVAQHH